ncbi:MAG: LytTR family transcriptional regulator DNA-binding domain-containing protein, partial [Bacteroidia bacterium]
NSETASTAAPTNTIESEEKMTFIYVKEDKKMVKIYLDKILFIESLKDYVCIHTNTRKIITKQQISYLEQKLPEDDFMRIHRSFIISTKKIKAFNEKRTTQFWETYGMTETASHIALKKIGYDKHFRPQSGVNLQLSENQLTIRIPELQFSIDTNDIAKIHGDGFEIIGRADDVINSGGIKIHPTIIEPKIKSVFSSASINRNFYISSIPDKTYGQKVILVLEGEPLKNESFLLEAIKRELPSYHNPKSILYVDSINRTDTGKLIRKAY